MTKNKKLLVCLMRAFLGFYGVDAFIMKKIPQGVVTAVIGVILPSFAGGLLGAALATGNSALVITGSVLILVVVARFLLYLIGGLLMLRKLPEEVEAMYK